MQVKRGGKGALPGSLPCEQTRAPLGILELVRTGRIAMVRGSPPTRELTEAADGARPAESRPAGDSLA